MGTSQSSLADSSGSCGVSWSDEAEAVVEAGGSPVGQHDGGQDVGFEPIDTGEVDGHTLSLQNHRVGDDERGDMQILHGRGGTHPVARRPATNFGGIDRNA